MIQHRRAGTFRRVPRAFALLAAVPLVALAGCGDPGDLRGAGGTPTAVGPSRLWPTLAPATTPALDYGEADTEVVEGVGAAHDDIRRVDPVAALRAQVAAHPDEYTGEDADYPETAERLDACTGSSSPGASRGKGCPVLQSYYRDLTGDGRDDLVLGFTLPGDQLAVRVYTFEKHRLVQVMDTTDAVIGVEFAGSELIIRAASKLPGYEYRTVWAWDTHQHAMLATRDEILRVGDGATTPSGSPAPRPSASPSDSPTASPSAE
ncbi:hypothetical protein ACIP79_08950 [Streptomyces sp. NPDC088747]|uniref:hypothetical protein n=1 Tax=Streptomyces sp. NPDC088747 TaxID=3365886 RepID=UPI00381D1609